MIKVDNKFYMIGEDKSLGSSFQNVNCYSSTDLVEWTYVGALLSRGSSGDLGPNRVVERPKVIFNKSTGKYVLYMHIDSGKYGEAKVGVATGDSVCGKYTYHRSFQPMGKQSRDMGLWVDDDGAAYLLSEDVSNLNLPTLWHPDVEQTCREQMVFASSGCLPTISPWLVRSISGARRLKPRQCSNVARPTICSEAISAVGLPTTTFTALPAQYLDPGLLGRILLRQAAKHLNLKRLSFSP